MVNKISSGFLRDAVIAAIVTVLGAVAIKYADLPTRVSVVESRIDGIQKATESIDSKIDILITRTR